MSLFFFFSSRRRHTRCSRDWSSDVCSSDLHPHGCSFGWEKIKEMKDNQIEFWAGDGFTRLRIVDVNERDETIYMITREGKKTWPLDFQKLEEVHNRIHRREIALLAYEIDKAIPMWGNYVSGLFKYLGCEEVLS